MSGDADSATSGTSSGPMTAPSAEDTTAYGVTVTLVGGVLLALSYYGYLAIRGSREIGQALPEPFYFLALALLFVVELLNSRQRGAVAVGRAIAFTAVYGALFVLAVEGGAYVWERPALVLQNFAGVTVLAASLVVAALVYFAYLTVLETGRDGR